MDSQESPHIQLVAVGNAPQPLDATMLQMELEAHGIDSIQDGEFTVAIDPLLSNAIGGVRVLVEQDQEQDARQILADFYRRRREDVDALERTCPKCGQKNADFLRPPFWLLALSWPRFECGGCGHRWR